MYNLVVGISWWQTSNGGSEHVPIVLYTIKPTYVWSNFESFLILQIIPFQ